MTSGPEKKILLYSFNMEYKAILHTINIPTVTALMSSWNYIVQNPSMLAGGAWYKGSSLEVKSMDSRPSLPRAECWPCQLLCENQ